MGLRRRRVDETVGSAIVPSPGEVTGWGGQPAGWEATGLLGPSIDLLSSNILQALITSGEGINHQQQLRPRPKARLVEGSSDLGPESTPPPTDHITIRDFNLEDEIEVSIWRLP